MATDVVLRRFQNEAQTTSRLDHANIVKATDFGLIDNNQPFLVMEYVEGTNSGPGLKGERKTFRRNDSADFSFRSVLPPVYAHQQGVVHRDIKTGQYYAGQIRGQIDRIRSENSGLRHF